MWKVLQKGEWREKKEGATNVLASGRESRFVAVK